jgi:hypothetical protein
VYSARKKEIRTKLAWATRRRRKIKGMTWQRIWRQSEKRDTGAMQSH